MPIEIDEDDEHERFKLHLDSMDKYQDVMDWEALVGSVDAIELGKDGELKVVLTMWVII